MTQIEWNNDLSIGIKLVDEHHKMLIQRLNDLSKAVEMHHGEAEIMKTLQFLIDYTTFHSYKRRSESVPGGGAIMYHPDGI